jgi:hypothetical protein
MSCTLDRMQGKFNLYSTDSDEGHSNTSDRY